MKICYTVSEVAKILNVTDETVKEWIEEYKIISNINNEGKYCIEREDLISFLHLNKIPAEILEHEYSGTKRVLIVDDEPAVLDALEARISFEDGLDAEGVSTAFEAGVFLRRYRPHVVVLDISLTDIDGRRVCEIFKADDELINIKIMAISGKINTNEEKNILSHGFDAYLRKPFDLNIFTDTIKSMLS